MRQLPGMRLRAELGVWRYRPVNTGPLAGARRGGGDEWRRSIHEHKLIAVEEDKTQVGETRSVVAGFFNELRHLCQFGL